MKLCQSSKFGVPNQAIPSPSTPVTGVMRPVNKT